MNCPHCGQLVIGPARTCLIHGDQLDVGNQAPVQESVRDQRVRRAVRPAEQPVEGPTP